MATNTFAFHMSLRERVQWLARHKQQSNLGGTLFPCEHGHLDCSTFAGGPCLDEVLGYLESLETIGGEGLE